MVELWSLHVTKRGAIIIKVLFKWIFYGFILSYLAFVRIYKEELNISLKSLLRRDKIQRDLQEKACLYWEKKISKKYGE